MTSQKKHKSPLIPALIFVIIIFILAMVNPFYLLFESAYTIGQYSGQTEGGGRTGRSSIYKYKVNNKEYKLFYKGGIPAQKVFIKFYPPNPKRSIFYWDKKVPPCKMGYKIPRAGWPVKPNSVCN